MPNEKSWRGLVALLLIAILGTYFGEQLPPLKDLGTSLWPPLQRTLDWIVAPTLPRGLLLLGVVITWFASAYFSKRATGVLKAAPEAAPVVAREEPRVEDFEPTRVQIIAARVLIERYPRRLQLPDLAAAMTQYAGGAIPMPVAPQGEIARQMEDLQRRGVANIDDINSPMAYYGLTRHGRNFMLEKTTPARARPPH